MTREQLELELAEAHVALQYLAIMSLRNGGVVTASEVNTVRRPLTEFHSLPDPIREQVKRIRKERWDIE